MGHWKAIRYLPAQHRKTTAARVPDSLGCAPARGGRGGSRPRGISHLPLTEGRGTQVPHAPDAIGFNVASNSGHSAQLNDAEPGFPRIARTGPARELSTAHASARKSDVDGSDPAQRNDAHAELRR